MGERVDALVLFGRFSIGANVIRNARSHIARHTDEGLVQLYSSIASEKASCLAFNRADHATAALAGSDRLIATSMCGQPSSLLVALVRNRTMLRALQYSYYFFVSQHGQVGVVDVCAVAGLAMNIHSWHESIHDEEDIRMYVLAPLIEGKDIAKSLAC
jgi:hypothetical protein